ncbi:MAG: ABC transporter ATP-binding protein [Pirellulales bacterium]
MTETSVKISTGDKMRSLMHHARWTILESWKISPVIMLGLLVVVVLRGAAPAGIAVFARELINAFVAVEPLGTAAFNALVPWLLLGFGFTLIEAIAPMAYQYLLQILHDEINLNVSTRVLRHAAKLDLSFFEDRQQRQIIELAQQNTAEHLSSFVSHLAGTCIYVLQAISLVAVLAMIEPLVLVVVGPCGIAYLLFKWKLSKQYYLNEQYRNTRRQWTTYFVSKLTNWQTVGEIKLLGLAELLIDRFHFMMKQFRDEDRKLHWRGFYSATLFAFLTSLAFFLVFAWLLFKALRGGATIGDIAIFGAATSRLRSILEIAITSVTKMMEQTLYISNLRNFLSVQPQLTQTGCVLPSKSRGEIELNCVTFTYPGAKKPTLHNVSLHIRPGEIIGVVGETGAGKTTLVKLLCRLYSPDSGSIQYDGIDACDLPLNYLHNQIGFLMQGFGRYEASAAENIAYGDWRRLFENHEGIVEVAKRANVHDMIEEMPEHYDTMLGRLGGEVDLSGGQWQKLALARAFARNASLLILDEPTSNLDARSEYQLFCQFRELANDRTTLLISHRFSTLRMADRLVVMEGGQIVECGTHRELLDNKGLYAYLYGLHLKNMNGIGEPAETQNDNDDPKTN